VPSTTLGYEKLFNPAFQIADENSFVEWLLDGQPEAPKYFAQMKHVNKAGPALLSDVPSVAKMTHVQLQAAVQDGALVVDFRDQEQFSAGHIPGTVNIPASENNFSTYVGWFVDYTQPLYIIAPDAAASEAIVRGLRAIGIDNIAGAMIQTGPMAADVEGESLPQMNASQLAERARHNGLVIVDVRGKSEYLQEHIRGAKHIPLGFLPDHLGELPHDYTIVTHCVSGYRSQIAASLLRKNGFSDVYSLNDRQAVWSQVMEIERA
jgi:hydroxyacylglutathione hydrolase